MPAAVSKQFGERWCSEKRSLVLLVPSVVARLDRSILINPAHSEFARLESSLHEPVYWDHRLFGT
jgi:RES domain-containing protein